MLAAQAIDRQTATHERRKEPTGRSSSTTFALTEHKAGTLVRMAEGPGVTLKITQRLADMLPLRRLPEMMRGVLSDHGED